MSSSSDAVGAFPPPAGTTPNFDNPESIAWKAITTAVVASAVALLFLMLRLYTKRRIVYKLHFDDYSVVLAWLFAFAYSIIQIAQTKNGSGRHVWDVTADQYAIYTKAGIPAAITYGLSTIFSKVSILVFYRRLSLEDAKIRVLLYFLMFVVVGYSLAGGFAFLYLCNPIEKIWNFATPGKCVDIYEAYLVGAGLNVATDIVILLLPLWLMSPLRLPARQKLGVILILMTGSFVCAISIVRLTQVIYGTKSDDSTWNYINNIIWCILEMNVGITCVCLPTLRAFARHYFPRIFDRSQIPSQKYNSELTGWTPSRTSNMGLTPQKAGSVSRLFNGANDSGTAVPTPNLVYQPFPMRASGEKTPISSIATIENEAQV